VLNTVVDISVLATAIVLLYCRQSFQQNNFNTVVEHSLPTQCFRLLPIKMFYWSVALST